ncbi:MAG: sugar phosphate nucleotidyltransferase [Nitrospirota bacterium]
MNSINVFILAAGLGERLRPITNHIPKPLIPILGKPCIEYVLERVSALPVNKIGINLHYKKDMIEEWVKKYFDNRNNPPSPPFAKGGVTPLAPLSRGESNPPLEKGDKGGFSYKKIVFFPEEQILGTGGALKNAEDFLREGTFLVHNSDIFTEIDLTKLLEYHRSSNNLVTLAVHDYPKFNSVIVDENGFLKTVETGLKPVSTDYKRCAFTGIAVYEPDFLKFLPPGKSSVVDSWLKAVSESRKIGTLNIDKGGDEPRSYWSDIGTPDAYAAAVFWELRSLGETIFIHSSIETCAGAEIQGNVVIGNGCNVTALQATSLLRNCIILPETNVGASHATPLQKESLFENCIIGPEFMIDLNEREIVPFIGEDKQLIGTGGSDRKYYRIKKDGRSRVFMQCREDDPDYERHIEYTKFFLGHSVPVPYLYEADNEKKSALLEDAGDISLYSWLKCPRDPADIEDIYRQVLDIISLIHTEVTDDVSSCAMLKNRTFDYDHFRWETDYFIKRFVEDVRNISIGNRTALDMELHDLAMKADTAPKVIIHRDFQSQNIMVMKGPKLRLIDYQGARMGPAAYDIASMLWDPYYRFEDNMRCRLLDYYLERMADYYKGRFDADAFNRALILCRLQRHMQALGAYGFLSVVKGKKYFRKHIPEALRVLREDVEYVRDVCPELYGLIVDL